jgi:sulfur carrier protein ThiS
LGAQGGVTCGLPPAMLAAAARWFRKPARGNDVQIVFKLHATLSDFLPRDGSGRKPQHNQLVLDVPEGSNVQSVVDRFRLPARLVHLVLVNGVYVPPSMRSKWQLKASDALAIWPPIAGG